MSSITTNIQWQRNDSIMAWRYSVVILCKTSLMAMPAIDVNKLFCNKLVFKYFTVVYTNKNMPITYVDYIYGAAHLYMYMYMVHT